MAKGLNESKVDLIYKVTDSAIYGFFREHRFLSNYHVCSIIYEGIEYTSSEAAYQAAHIYYPDSLLRTNIERARFALMSPVEAKRETHKKWFKDQIRPDWESIKIEVMHQILMYKFTVHPDLRELLLQTGDKLLEETNYWNDTFWGVCKGVGENHLGKVLMKIRNKLKIFLPNGN